VSERQKCDRCGEPIEKLFDESVRSRKKMTAYFICSECYQEDYDEAMSQIDY
jgi:uncharacterized protein with PIN domain